MISSKDALKILRQHEHELRALGVRRAAIFGSVSRDEATHSSDLDILVELDSSARLTVFDYANIKQTIAELFPVRTDVVNARALKMPVSKTAKRDAVYAF